MRVTMMLADAAQTVNGKLYILGGGWSQLGPAPTPFAVVLKIEVPYDQANRRHRWQLQLEDESGQAVRLATPQGEQAVQMGSDFEVQLPPGLPAGTPLDVPLVIQFGPLPLSPGRRYSFQLKLDDRADQHWRLPFSTRPVPVVN